MTTWRDISTHVPLICIDTPGFGDSEGRDPDHIDNIVSSLKTIGFVNTFIITWNCLENRFSEQLDSTIRLLSQIFSSDFFSNVLICFTKFAHDKKSVSLRKKGKNLEKDQWVHQMQDQFKNRYGCSLRNNQFCFIDNSVFGEMEDLEMEEIAEFENCMEDILEFTMKSKPFICKDIKSVLNEVEELKQMLALLIVQFDSELKDIKEDLDQRLQTRMSKFRSEENRRLD